jgi:outer membrane protein
VKGDLNLGNSSGLAMQAGFDYAFNDNMGLTMSVYKMDIDTTATVYANDTKVTSFEVAIDPMVYMAGVFYRF